MKKKQRAASRVHHATKSEPDTDAADELKLYIDNDADLYGRQTKSILKNLATKKVKSAYAHDLAVKAFGYLVESGAKKYVKEFGSPDQPWHKMFDAPTRKLVAEDLAREFETEFELGNYDDLLPKKYKKELSKQYLVPPHRHQHARKAKSMADYEAEGYKAQTWYHADSPYSQPKIRDAWQRGAWKWQQEQRAGRSAKETKSPAQLQREIDAVIGRRGR